LRPAAVKGSLGCSPIGLRVLGVVVKHRHRFWWEIVLACLSAVLAVLTAFVPDWIELVFQVDPDGGSGSVEWLVVVALAGCAVISAWAARREHLATAPGS
jgi:hypothetical protein